MLQDQQTAKPEQGFLRLRQIIGDPRRGIEPLIPVSAATWWRGCKRGLYPKPHKLGPNITAWRRAEVLAILNETDARGDE